MLVDLCSIFQAGAVRNGPGPNFGRKLAQHRPKLKYLYVNICFSLQSTPQLPALWPNQARNQKGFHPPADQSHGGDHAGGSARHKQKTKTKN